VHFTVYISKLSTVILLFAAAHTSSPAQFTVDTWTTDKELPQASVNSIIQTRDNYLWLATLDGLVRFDGVRFTVFNKSNSPGIDSNRFYSLFEDAAGDLWASTEQNGLVRRHKGEFTSFGLESGLTSLRHDWITGDANGSVVAYPPRLSGVVRWTGERFEPFEHTAGREFPNAPAELLCTRIGGSFDCYGGGSKYTVRAAEAATWDWSETFKAATNGDSAIWARPRTGELIRIASSAISEVKLPGRPLGSVNGSGLGYFWANTDGTLGLTRILSMQPQQLITNAPTAIIAAGGFLSTLEDDEGNIWVGTTRGGLSVIRRQLISTLSTESGLSDNNIYPIFQDRGGTIWVGTNRGLFKYESGRFVRIEEAPAASVNAIGEDAEGRLIFACEGIRTLMDGAAPLVTDYQPVLTRVYAIHMAGDGSLWVGGQGGVARIKNGVQELFTMANGLAGDDVKAIIADGRGGTWFGAYGGLSHYTNGQMNGWTKNDGLPSESIRSLFQDAEGTLWIGSYDGGLARFKNGEFTSITRSSGLFNDGVFQILEDDGGYFWISSNRGVYRVHKDELNLFADGHASTVTSIGYGISDGMKNVECNGGRSPAGIRTREGKLWFPTQDGVAVIDPQNIFTNPKPPPVMIEEIRVDNKRIGPADLTATLDGTNGGLTIQPNQTNFEVEYTALSFINSKNSRFRYRLDGLEPNWVDAGTRRTAYYSHVPPGTYTFRVIAANSDGVWNNAGAAMTVRVIPPFYRQWWFNLMVTGALVLIVIALYRQRIGKLKERGRRQEEFTRRLLASQEDERQRIAAAMHDTLGQSLLIIKNRVAIARNNLEDPDTVDEQLAELSDSASVAIDECREIAYNLRPFQISRFGLTKSLAAIFESIGEVTQIKVEVKIADIDGLVSEEAEISVFRIVQESANNIIKHSNAETAWLTIDRIDRGIRMFIRDDGVGFELRASEKYQTSRSGFGLAGIAERIKMLGGKIVIHAAPGAGTTMIIKIDKTNLNG
jgi:signal transduction histidine kinase/ligand-binding sensor domain-containing protein